jgi:predicted Zn-dependent protease
MSKLLRSRRTSYLVASVVALATLLLIVLSSNEAAKAQFPKLPINLPKPPSFPMPGGNGMNRKPDVNDLKNLADLGKKWGELNDLNNYERQNELGQSIALGILNRYPLSKNKALNQYVNKVGLTVASVSPRPDLNYSFGVLETTEIGAYSTPGGYVFVTQGALNVIHDESELAGVLAHEVAHLVKNHGIEAVKSAKFKDLSSSFVQKFGQKYAAYNQQVEAGLTFALEDGYSRNQEREADADAIKYLVAARYDPRGFVRFLQRMQDRLAKTQRGAMKTHPGTAERIGSCTRQIAALPNIGGATMTERYQIAAGQRQP